MTAKEFISGRKINEGVDSFFGGVVLKFAYPLLMFLGTFLKTKKTDFQAYIVTLNNLLLCVTILM